MLWFSWFHVILYTYLNYFIIVILYSSAFWANMSVQIFCPCFRTAIKCGKDYYAMNRVWALTPTWKLVD